MSYTVIFVGSIYQNNVMLFEYAKRAIKKQIGRIDTLYFFNENDKEIFLSLETFLSKASKILLITPQANFSTVGKLLCTLTADSQIVKEGMLLPSQTEIYAQNSYLLHYRESYINVIGLDAARVMPDILYEAREHQVILQLFEESEEKIKVMLAPLAESFDVSIKIDPFIEGWFQASVKSNKFGELSSFVSAVKSLMGKHVIASANIIAFIIDRLTHAGKKISFAESCTGGMLASLFTKEGGASSIFEGSIVSYANRIKNAWLGVDEALLIEHGAVSSAVAMAMSQGIAEVAEADFGIGISGIAGPTGAVEGKPVGTVFVSFYSQKVHRCYELHLEGDRNYIQIQSAYFAIKTLIEAEAELFF